MTDVGHAIPLQTATERLELELGLTGNGRGHTDAEWAMLWLAYSNLLLVKQLTEAGH